MNHPLIEIGFFISGAMVTMMVIGIVLSALMPALDRWSRQFFVTFFALLLTYAVILSIDMIIFPKPDMASVERVIVILEYTFFSVLTFFPMIYMIHFCGESLKNSVLFRTVIALWCVFFILLIATQFMDMFYYITPDNQYFRGPLFPLMLSPLAAIMLLNIGSLMAKQKKLSRRIFFALFVYMLPTTILVTLYMFASVDILVTFWMTLCAITMFALILTDNMKQYMQQQRKIAHQHASVMVLQMRPHFIYNTMMGIYYLCDQDPQKAKQVTLDFTTYLRKNFAAIASEDTVPFKDELEHTRAYLAVEQAQFEDSLFVRFDTPHTLFRLPPLTLQPIVENSVKHGLSACTDPIHITVITRQTDSASEIIVEDDGPGFKPVDDNEPHIALNNIRERLEMMCRGKLEISLREGGGTSVKVIIPLPSH